MNTKYQNPDIYGYDERYDAYYDKQTLEWIDKKCPVFECYYCKDRPEIKQDDKNEKVT